MHCTWKKIILYWPHANRTYLTMTLLTTDLTPSTDSPAYDGWGTHAMLEDLLCRRFAGRIALVYRLEPRARCCCISLPGSTGTFP